MNDAERRAIRRRAVEIEGRLRALAETNPDRLGPVDTLIVLAGTAGRTIAAGAPDVRLSAAQVALLVEGAAALLARAAEHEIEADAAQARAPSPASRPPSCTDRLRFDGRQRTGGDVRNISLPGFA